MANLGDVDIRVRRAYVAGAQRSVADGSKECRSQGGVYAGGRNAGEMGVQRLNLSFTDRRRVRVE